MPLRNVKCVSVDLATGTGKSYVIYGLAVIALAEGLVDKVLVLCPSLTIEDGLREKFETLIGNRELTAIMKEIGALVATPGLKTGNESVGKGDMCVENIHAVYERTGTSIYDSFKGQGSRTLVLNDEAHHIFSKAGPSYEEMAGVPAEPGVGFPVHCQSDRYALRGERVFPGRGLPLRSEAGHRRQGRQETQLQGGGDAQETFVGRDVEYPREEPRGDGAAVKPITIVVTESIATCVEVWDELVRYLMEKADLSREEAEKKCIWVTSGLPAGKADKCASKPSSRSRRSSDR